MSTRTVPRGTDRKARTLKVRPVNLEVDDAFGAWVVFVSPTIDGRALGIGYHRARLPKCSCIVGFSGKNHRCRNCGGWDALGMADYLRKLLRSYPMVRMAAEGMAA